jgi:hypothetical protein
MAGRVGRAIALGILVIFLLAGAYNGLVEGSNVTRFADQPGMRVAAVTQLLYGAAAVVALLALATRRRWTVLPVAICFLAATITGGLAPVVYGDQPVLTGVLSGAVSALVLGLVFWAWWRTSHRPQSPTPNL